MIIHHAFQEADGHFNDGIVAGGARMPAHEELWEAALAGNAHQVQRMLRNLPAEMMHPETGSTLLLDVAAVHTEDGRQDYRLGQVMATLVRAGGSLRRRLFPENDTPLHLLAAQPRSFCVHHRVMFVLDCIARDRRPTSLLIMRNGNGQTPEQVAGLFRSDLRALLLIRRQLIPEQADLRVRRNSLQI